MPGEKVKDRKLGTCGVLPQVAVRVDIGTSRLPIGPSDLWFRPGLANAASVLYLWVSSSR